MNKFQELLHLETNSIIRNKPIALQQNSPTKSSFPLPQSPTRTNSIKWIQELRNRITQVLKLFELSPWVTNSQIMHKLPNRVENAITKSPQQTKSVKNSLLDWISSTTLKAYSTKSTFLYLCEGLIFILGLSPVIKYDGTVGGGDKVALSITSVLDWDVFSMYTPNQTPMVLH